MGEDEEVRAELAAMQAIVEALTPLALGPDNGSIVRVLRWTCDRYGVDAS